MDAVKVLHKWARASLPEIHRRRLSTLFAGVESVLRGQRLWLTAVGRNIAGEAFEKHRIKRIDRLLGNRHLSHERSRIYAWLGGLVIGGNRHPCIIVDWSDINTTKPLFLLRAAVSVGGRALTVYEEVHSRYHHRQDTSGFLKRLAQVLPPACQPIIVTDAGFKSPWFKAIEALGWFYVGRVRSRDYICFPDSDSWLPAKSLYRQARTRPRALGALWIPRSAPMLTAAYVYRKRAKGRHRLNAHGQSRRNGPSLKHAKREREPWLLVSNLPPRRHIAKRIVAIYRDRMTIEQAFRDLKAHRHGFALRQNLGRQPERVANLLLIAAIAMLAAWLTGLVGIRQGLHRRLQANTETQRAVLSVFFVGLRLICHRLTLAQHDLRFAIQNINDAVLTSAHHYH